MPFEDTRKLGVHWPMWQQCLPAPTAPTAVSGMCAPDVGPNTPFAEVGRYIYYLVASTFYRFDTYENSWMQLSSPNIAPATGLVLKYSPYAGHRGKVVSAAAGSVTFAVVDGQMCHGQVMRIVAGTGKGQERMLLGPANIINTRYHEGRNTLASSAAAVADSGLRMKVNEHVGRQVALTYNAGQPQIRPILYNDATTVTVQDTNYQQICPYENMGFSATAPNALPVNTANVATHFVIEDNTYITADPSTGLPQNWTTTPDGTSRFVLLTGGIFLLSSLTTPFFSFQYYDVLTDVWMTKTTPTSLILAAATEWTLERCGEVAGALASGTADVGSTTRVLVDAAAAWPDATPWTTDCFANFEVRITGGTGIGQRRRVIANTATSLTVDKLFSPAPDGTSTYELYGHANKIYARFGGSAGLYQYCADADLWSPQYISDYGLAANMSVTMTDHQPVAVTSATRNTGCVTVLNTTPTAAGSGYLRGEVLTITTGGTNAQAYIEEVGASGAVTRVSLYRAGAGYTTGAGKATSGGSGTLCTLDITTVGTVGRITTAINHYFRTGDSVTFAGAVEAAWNTTYTILCVNSLTDFDVVTTATAAPVASNSQGVSLIVDASKAWTVNEHTGKWAFTQPAGLTGTQAARRITSNTATTLTLTDALGGALTNGTGRYCICDAAPLGREALYKDPTRDSVGYATAGGATSLTDSTKNWVVNQWAACKFKVISGTGFDGAEVTITSNTKDTLTYAAPGFTPDATSKYIIYDTFGKCTGAGSTTTLNDTAKNWPVNGLQAKRVRIIAGAGVGNEMTITTNTATQLTFAAVTGLAPDATTEYVIYGPPAMGAGGSIIWVYGSEIVSIRSKYMFSLRGGGSNTGDSYDITKMRWDLTLLSAPSFETFGAGTQVAYDGDECVYIQPTNTGRIYKFNLTKFRFDGMGQLPYAQGTVIAGNRMELVETPDGARLLYIMRNSGQEVYRRVVFDSIS